MDKLDEALYKAHKKSEKAIEEWREKAEEALEEAKRDHADWVTLLFRNIWNLARQWYESLNFNV